MSGISDLGQRVADLYKEIVTTTVRFESLHRETTSTLTDFKAAVQRCDERLQQMHLDHVRERAELSSQINALEGRLNALSESALHAVAREAARHAMHAIVNDGEAAPAVLRAVADGEVAPPERRLGAA